MFPLERVDLHTLHTALHSQERGASTVQAQLLPDSTASLLVMHRAAVWGCGCTPGLQEAVGNLGCGTKHSIQLCLL